MKEKTRPGAWDEDAYEGGRRLRAWRGVRLRVVRGMTACDRTVGAQPWDCDWAAERAAAALRYLGRNAPEVLENARVLEPHEEAANQAAMRGDEIAYLDALRAYCKAGRAEALRIRRGVA